MNISFRTSSLTILMYILLFLYIIFISIEQKFLLYLNLQWLEWKSETSRTIYILLVSIDRVDDDK